ncbi:MAG TPA: sulfatase, partial [Candidatus Limnocylindria bacterium]|nr:sulfatase [Candidatus Limnocylindria bacterium]
MLLAVLEVALLSLIPATALRNHEIPLGARLFLLCYALTVLNLFLILIGASLKLLVPITQRLGLDRKKRRWLGAMLPSFALGSILLVYAASWAAYWQIGSFIDSRVFLFMAPHPLQVFHWVDRDAALAVLALAVALTIVTRRAVPALLSILSPSTQTGIVRFWVVASLACLMGTFFGELYSGWGQRQYMRAAIAYRQSFDNATGPLPFVLTEIRRRLQSQANNPAEAKGIDIVRRPIVPMDQYLANAGQSDLKRWNVVLLIVESLRADQLRIYGGARDVMPTVDALAQESQVFLDAFTQSSHTNYATVVPFSSHYPLRSATPYNNYPENPPYPRVLIYDILKALGYKTGMFSSSNEYWGGMTYYFDTGHLDRYLHAANFDGPTYVIQSDVGFAAWVRRTKHAGSINDRLTVDEAMRWLDGLEPKNPFFLSVTFQSSHLPYPVPPEFRRRFAPDKLDFKIRFGQFPRDRADIAKDLYADSLAYVDNQIARLFEHLKRQGRWGRTLIVVTSDHGQAFFEHGFVAHGGPLFNEVMKVPLVVRAPGLAPALKDRPAQHVDI